MRAWGMGRATISWGLLAACAVGGLACGDTTAIEHLPPIRADLAPPAPCSNSGLSTNESGQAGGNSGFYKVFRCGALITIGLGTHSTGANVSYLNSELQQVVDKWNEALSGQDVGMTASLNLPRMTLNQSGGGTITVNFGASGPSTAPGTRFCGPTTTCYNDPNGPRCATSTSATINGDQNVNACIGNYTYYSSLHTWLAHETGHALGFASAPFHSLDVTHNGHCLMNLSGSAAPSQFGTLCQYEIEKLFYRYGIRTTDPDQYKHIMTGLDLSSVPPLAPRGTATLSVVNLVFEKANAAALCPNMENSGNLDLRYVGCDATLSPAGYTIAFTSSDPQVVSVSAVNGASATLTGGTKFGSATITVTVNPGVHQLATLFGRIHKNVAAITVAGTLAINDGNNQTADAGSTLPIAPSVSVKDLAGHSVPGLPVTFAVVGSGGSITGASATTDASGIARVGSWTLGTTVGTDSLRATVAGLSPVTFVASGISPFVVTPTAPSYVTNKATYALAGSASQSATAWRWDRSDDDGATWSLWANSQNSSFVSYLGCYTIGWRLTATRISDGVVRSNTTTTTVANTSGCGPPP
jgi:hypothetical protein